MTVETTTVYMCDNCGEHAERRNRHEPITVYVKGQPAKRMWCPPCMRDGAPEAELRDMIPYLA